MLQCGSIECLRYDITIMENGMTRMQLSNVKGNLNLPVIHSIPAFVLPQLDLLLPCIS